MSSISELETQAESLSPSNQTSLPRLSTALLFGLDVEKPNEDLKHSLANISSRRSRVISQMDPRLQVVVARQYSCMPSYMITSATHDEIPVIAIVKNIKEWEEMSEVRIGARIGQIEGGNWIVTGRIPVRRIEAVHNHQTVVSLKATQPMQPILDATISETGASDSMLTSKSTPEGGKGVVIGIVDFGCDFAHKNFRISNGESRIEAIWDQSSRGKCNSEFGYGRVYRTNDINAALQTHDPYLTLDYAPARDPNGTHGTHVMDIAAGNGLGSGVTGCAPEATIIFVDLSATDIGWEGAKVVDTSFGDSVRLLEAVKFVFDEAGDRPCVVNISLGTNGGPHDGTTLVEKGLDVFVRAKPNRAVVIAASNTHEEKVHASATVPQGGTIDLSWKHPRENQPAELDIWISRESQVAVDVDGQTTFEERHRCALPRMD